MSTKSVKKCKHPKKMKSSKPSAKPEVFVLPPDILKQLGISIGLGNVTVNPETIPTPPKIVPNSDVVNYENINKITTSCNSRDTSESSILETANLMKKSVFLSPTFVPTVSNAISGEIQLVCNNNVRSSEAVETELVDTHNVLEPVDSTEIGNALPAVNNMENVSLIQDQIKLTGDFTVNEVFPPVSNGCTYEDAETFNDDDMQIENSIPSQIIIGDESNVVDLFAASSNNNVISTDDPNVQLHIFDKNEISDIIKKSNTKINIISDESITISKPEDIQLQSSQDLSPVPVNTVVATQKVNKNKILMPHDTTEIHLVLTEDNTEHESREPNKIDRETNQNNNNLHIEKEYDMAPLEATKQLDHTINVFKGNTLDNMDICMEGDQTQVLQHSPREVEVNPETCHSENLINGDNTLIESKGQLEVSEEKHNESESIQVPKSDPESNNNKSPNNTEIANHDKISDKSQSSSMKESIEKAEGKCNLESQNNRNQNSKKHKIKNAKSKNKSKSGVDSDRNKSKSSSDEHNNLPIKDVIEKPLPNENSVSISDGNPTIITQADKVKEIAAYLRKLSHIYTDKKKAKTQLANDTTIKETIQSNTNMIKSKLCIQGVEKPGGKSVSKGARDESKTIKTYARSNKQKPLIKNTKALRNIEKCVVVQASDQELNIVDISKPCITQEFCICHDFGRMSYCDHGDDCEHVHFANITTNSNLDLIFSIYSDEVLVNNNVEVEIIEEQKTEEIVETQNFCWNVFDSEDFGLDDIDLNTAGDRQDFSCGVKSSGASDNVDYIKGKNSSATTETLDEVDAAIINTPKSTANIKDAKSLNANNSSAVISDNKKEYKKKGGDRKSSETLQTTSESKDSDSEDVSLKVLKIAKDNKKEKNSSKAKENASNESQNKETKNNSEKSKEKEKQVSQESTKVKENKAQKRRLSDKSSSLTRRMSSEPSHKKNIKCALCNNLFSEEEWGHHVATQHQHIAWKAGQSIDLDNPELLNKLSKQLKKRGFLECPICATEKKKLKSFIIHVKSCIEEKAASTNSKDKGTRRQRLEVFEEVTCGVCQQSVPEENWLEHIGKEHNYLSWKDGQDEPWDVEDEALVSQHLLNIVRGNVNLICYKCGLQRRRVKMYLSHIKSCDGTRMSVDDSMSVDPNTSSIEIEIVESKTVQCGVCKQDMPTLKWMEHIAKEHNYLAWQEGDTPVDLEDEEAVWKHLLQIIRDYGCLICHKCGLSRKRVKLYLTHIETCDGTGVSLEDSYASEFNASNVGSSELNKDKDVECGVCHKTMPASDWVDHICKNHNYLAWKVGEPPLDVDNEEAIWNHLQQYIRSSDGLICHKCGLQRRRVKLYLSHVTTCDGSVPVSDVSTNNISVDNSNNRYFEVPIETNEKKNMECGVCNETVPISQWVLHIGQRHNYLAWPAEGTPLDLEDVTMLRSYLLNVSKQIGGLICYICGKNIKYSKTYLSHVKECTGVSVVPEDSTSNCSAATAVNKKVIKSEPVVCGVCEATVEGTDWLNHMHKAHQYIAWIEGEPPIDANDPEMVQRHLYDVSKMTGGLKCLKCGVRRKYVKTYLQHVESCEGSVNSSELPTALMSKDELECALCAAKVVPKDWRDHAMKQHYNVAWVVGDLPIDLNSPYLVEGYIKEYLRRFNKLVCKNCGVSRVSCVGFYAHILTCGKTEEETEQYKATCEICNNKYLRIYKSQHMTVHREAEYSAERKLLLAKERELKRQDEDKPVEVVFGRRKAAEKAKTVIEKYKDALQEGGNHCSKCGFNTEVEGELLKHVCVDQQWGEVSDSDESVKMDSSSWEESDESDVDSNISEEEREAYEEEIKKKRYSDTTPSKVVRLPYQVRNPNAYMKRCAEEYAANYLTDEDLFPQWHSCEYEAVPENEIVKYMPPVEESCNVRNSESQSWKTLKRFGSERDKDTLTLFVGACIQCMSWVPGGRAQFLSLVSHRHSDVPRYAWDSSHTSRGLVQIWDCGDFTQYTPKFVLGLAHDYGTFWAMDWCPSGARDLVDFVPKENQVQRLGMFAAACSNGNAYIFCVPYPSTITENDKLFYKIKPVVELRLTMSRDRKDFQATSIKWSAQKGHSHVVVGYSDGCTAFYDLNGDSPLLKTIEGNITVFYPYHDERVQNSCIEDVDVFPRSGASAAGGGVVCGGGAGGAGAGALQSHVAASRLLFPPHWPAALLAGDDCLVNQSINELEWYGNGRRLGGVRCAAGCAWCGRVAAAALPLLRLLRLHPCYTELHKLVIGTIQMIPLGSKRKRQNDELGMTVEPITYNEVVKKYGIEFKPIATKDRATQQKLTAMPRDTYPERFPLSDVTSMKFCPTQQYHDKLAVALHAGFIFITTT